MSDDVICLSSDDEIESPPPKRIKPAKVDKDVFNKINNLRDINLKPCGDTTVIKKSYTEENNLIIIELDGKSKENQNNIVNLTDLDESIEEIVADPLKSEEINTSSECFIVGSDSETEENKEAPVKETTPPPPKEENGVQEKVNGFLQNGHSSPSPPSPKIIEKVEEKNVSSINNDDILNRPSTSRATESHKLLDEFLEICAKSMKGSKYEAKVLPKFSNMKKNFDKCKDIHAEPNFMKMLQEYTSTAKISAPEAVVSFQRIYSYLLDNVNGVGIDVSEDELKKLKKLEKHCRILLKRLRKLEEAELNFEDDEDSTYIMIDRYSQRLNVMYKKYCELLQKSPYSGRLLYERLHFVSSKYNEINRAITKSYAKDKEFPSYYKIEKIIRKCVQQHNLGLSEGEILEESRNCFTSLGKLLQLRRKKELYEVHCGFIALNEDPANKDDELKTKLQESLQEGDKKMKQVVDKYVRMQEDNVSVELSEDEDSDNSNYQDSGSEADG